eukprot:507280_1
MLSSRNGNVLSHLIQSFSHVINQSIIQSASLIQYAYVKWVVHSLYKITSSLFLGRCVCGLCVSSSSRQMVFCHHKRCSRILQLIYARGAPYCVSDCISTECI